MLNIISGIQTKPRDTYPLEWPKLKRLTTACVDNHVEKPSHKAGGNTQWYSHYGKQFGSYLINKYLPYNSVIPLLGRYLFKRNEITCLHKDLYINVHRHFIHNSPKLELAQVSTNGRMDNKRSIFIQWNTTQQ